MDVNNRSVFTKTTRRSHLALAWSYFNLVLVLCGGCAVAPRQETRLFATAFTNFNGASQPLFDDLAVAERRQGQDNAEVRAKKNSYQGECAGIIWASVTPKTGFIEGFCLDDASFFSEIGDPPATRVFREAVHLIGAYVEVLVTLAEGRNVDEASAQVQSLGSNIAALASFASGPGAGAGAAVTGALKALDPIIRDAAQQKNVEEMQRLVITGAPYLKALIDNLRKAAPKMFNTLSFQSVKSATSAEALNTSAVAKPHLDRIVAYREAVANYVTLLDDLENAFDDLIVAVQKPRNAVSLAIVAERSARLSANADSWRRTYSALRVGSQ
jgi:hypothetical protein